MTFEKVPEFVMILWSDKLSGVLRNGVIRVMVAELKGLNCSLAMESIHFWVLLVEYLPR